MLCGQYSYDTSNSGDQQHWTNNGGPLSYSNPSTQPSAYHSNNNAYYNVQDGLTVLNNSNSLYNPSTPGPNGPENPVDLSNSRPLHPGGHDNRNGLLPHETILASSWPNDCQQLSSYYDYFYVAAAHHHHQQQQQQQQHHQYYYHDGTNLIPGWYRCFCQLKF
eukprot:TCALIF_02350-PA protein Name:"Protein of unknown function" AED:0.66 eAED:0.66 QI:0/0.33/0.25/0.5/1/1/4/0/162